MNFDGQDISMTEGAIAARLSALAHPARLAILRHLSARHCSCCKDVVQSVELAQSTVSQHLKVLVEAGLVRDAPTGSARSTRSIASRWRRCRKLCAGFWIRAARESE